MPISVNGTTDDQPKPAVHSQPAWLGKFVGVRPKVLRYTRADRSPQRYGSLNTGTVTVDCTGLAEFKAQIMPYICDHFQQRQVIETPFYLLVPSDAVAKAHDVLDSISSLANPTATTEELNDRLLQLTTLSQGRPSPHQAEIDEIARQAVADVIQPILDSLRIIENESPLALKKVSQNLRDVIDRLQYPEAAIRGVQQLLRLRDLLQAIDQDPTSLPLHKHESIRREALHYGQKASRSAIHSVVTEQCNRQFRLRAAELRQESEAMHRRADESLRYLDAVEITLQQEWKRARLSVASGNTEGRIVLPSLSVEQVLMALCQHYDCTKADLVTKLAHEFAEGLRKQCSDQLSESDGPLESFRRATVADGLAVLKTLVDDRVEGQSVYAAIDRYGIDQMVTGLVYASAPLFHLDRNSVVNNIEETRLSILTVPAAKEGRDQEIQEQLFTAVREAMNEAGQGMVALRTSQAIGQSCHLTCSIMGYPAAVQAEVDVLAWAYVESKEINHCCHLFGVLPDCTDGQASEIVVEILHQEEIEV